MYLILFDILFSRGRITASVFRSTVITSLSKPSVTTIKNICYGQKFSTAATRYGCQHEATAIDTYKKEMQDRGHEMTTEASGLILNKKFPEFGASPDALVSNIVIELTSIYIL
jgi:YqaJ-like viral recombinase domain